MKTEAMSVTVLLATILPAQAAPPPFGHPHQLGYFQTYQYAVPFQGPPNTGMFQTFPSTQGGFWSYGVSTRELPGGYLIELALQGIPPSEISMSVRGGALVFERAQASGDPSQGTFGSGGFFWTLPLPADADVTRVTGRADSTGIRIFIPKQGG